MSFLAVFGLISDTGGMRSPFWVTATAMLFTAPVLAHPSQGISATSRPKVPKGQGRI